MELQIGLENEHYYIFVTGTLTVVDPHISKNVDYNVIFLSNFLFYNVV